MKLPGFFVFLVVFQTTLNMVNSIGIRPNSQFSCALGFNFASLSDESLNHELFKNVKKKVSFHLYTKEKLSGEIIEMSEKSLKSSSFDFGRPTKIITHGYYAQGKSASCVLTRDAFLKNYDYNVLVVDWWKMESILGVPVIYSSACKSIKIVAEYLTEMIDFLETQGLNLNDTTLIGHSLGAHLMGIAASKTKSRIKDIVGLDPAGPDFEDKNPSDRLSPDDANTVYAIHTNEGNCGISKSVGHFDFYPNGGKKQPGCKMNPCAHSRSFHLYAESISTENGFYANLCTDLNSALKGTCNGDVVKMDDELRIQKAKEGIYHFVTGQSTPFAVGGS